MTKPFYIVAAWICISIAAHAQQPVRICTYNVLKFGTAQTDAARIAALETVLDGIRPTILVTQEIFGVDGAQKFQSEVLQFVDSRLTLAPFTDGPDSDNALFVDTSVATVVDHHAVPTSLRNLDVWIVAIKDSPDTIAIAGCHLKASDDSDSRNQRASEASALNSALRTYADRWHCVVAGDFNVYTADEEAYQILTAHDTSVVMDPLQRPGDWHNDDSFAGIHTQATHDTASGGFISGGMDDRFDFVLLSPSLMGKYIVGSYTAYGNDGLHLNNSINAEPPNAAVSQEIANALFNASDHIPVYLDLQFKQATGVEAEPVQTDLNLW